MEKNANGEAHFKRVRELGKKARSEERAQSQIRKRNRGAGAQAEWGDVNAELIARVISAVGKRGCAIQFGYTRDGGAYFIRIVGDGEPYNEFVRPTEDVELHLTGLLDDFTNG